MMFFYSMALLPILVGLVLWGKNKEVIWWEWLASSALALMMAALFHWIALEAQCRDHELFSGRLINAVHYPWWQDKVRVEDYRTETYHTGSGKNRRTHTRRVHTGHHYEYNNHPEYWEAEGEFGAYLGNKTYRISQEFFDEICRNFCGGTPRVEQPHKSNFYKGDKNVYIADNKTDYCYPLTHWVSFENRVKACPSLYSYAPVPAGIPVLPYPKSENPFTSDRLMGTAAKTVSQRNFDVFCSRLGPTKKVNVILIGFGQSDSEIAHYQEASWIGGKKNDIVLCYGGPDPLHPSWTYVFGWTESSLVKANLQTILLQNQIDDSILPLLHSEIVKNYEIKDWKKFNYLQVDPPPWSYWVYILTMILCQGAFWAWASVNEFGKGCVGYRADFGRKIVGLNNNPFRRTW